MSELYLSIDLYFDDLAKLRDVKEKLQSGYKKHLEESGEELKQTLQEMFGSKYADYIFSPLKDESDLEKLLPYLKDKISTRLHWAEQQVTCKDKERLWMDSFDSEIFGYAVFPEKVDTSILKNQNKLTLRYPCTGEQIFIKTAFLSIAFEIIGLQVKSENEKKFEPHDFEDADSD